MFRQHLALCSPDLVNIFSHYCDSISTVALYGKAKILTVASVSAVSVVVLLAIPQFISGIMFID